MPSPSIAAESLEQGAAELYSALSELVRVYQFRDRKRICYHGVSVTQCYALSALLRLGPSRLDALAGELYLDKSTASRVVDSLERKGYLRRRSDRNDGRAIRIEATRQGKALHARIERDLIAEQKLLLADVDPLVRRAAADLILKLARTAQSRFGRDGAACADATEPLLEAK